MGVAALTAFPLKPNRVHEVCGAAAHAFAAVCCAQRAGEVLWVVEAWRAETLNPVGLSLFLDPRRLLLARVKDQTEALAVMEEALRSGAAPLVVAELGKPLDLTPGRRLQLAAEAGRATGLCLIAEGQGSNAAESRWRCAPLCDSARADSTLMRWGLIKNKAGTLGAWDVRWEHAARRLDVVSPVGERPGSAGAPG